MKPSAKSSSTPPAPPPPAPAFDRLKAVRVAPARHGGTARTFLYVQPDGERAHLFSYAQDYIATVSAAEAQAYMPKAAPTAKPLVLTPANVAVAD